VWINISVSCLYPSQGTLARTRRRRTIAVGQSIVLLLGSDVIKVRQKPLGEVPVSVFCLAIALADQYLRFGVLAIVEIAVLLCFACFCFVVCFETYVLSS
jgi:hypothetical protein